MMPTIKTKTRKGKLTKVDGKWVVDYVAESAKMIEKTEIPIFLAETLIKNDVTKEKKTD